MKGVTFQAAGVVTTELMDSPVIERERDAIVKVSMAGLCGSDLHPFFGREVGLLPGTVMGHELVGVVQELGSGISPSTLAVGDRVFAPFSTNCGDCFYCQAGLTSRCTDGQLFGWRQQDGQQATGLHGCQSEYVRVPLADATLMRLPEGISDEAALLLGDNFSTGFFCAEMANIQPGSVNVLIGCGTVGQLGIIAAKSLGAETLIAVDPVESRLRQAEALGAIPVSPENAASEVAARTNGRGADSVMELVGLPEAQKLAFQLIRPGGTMSVIGCHCTPHFSFGPVDAYDKNLTYRTGRCPARSYMNQLTERVHQGEFEIDSLITHRFAMDDSVRAYEVFSQKLDNCTKAVLVP